MSDMFALKIFRITVSEVFFQMVTILYPCHTALICCRATAEHGHVVDTKSNIESVQLLQKVNAA